MSAGFTLLATDHSLAFIFQSKEILVPGTLCAFHSSQFVLIVVIVDNRDVKSSIKTFNNSESRRFSFLKQSVLIYLKAVVITPADAGHLAP